jgi:acyl carrier protein
MSRYHPTIDEEDDVATGVVDIISEQMGYDRTEIYRDMSLIMDLNADSLDTVELVMEYEDRFGIDIPDEEAEKLGTVGLGIDYVKAALAKKSEQAQPS